MVSEKLKRKEISLTDAILKELKKLAEKDTRSVKSYMEKILIEHVKGKPQYNVYGNSKAFHDFLTKKGIKFRPNGHFTIIIGEHDLFALGEEFGILKYTNTPLFTTKAEYDKKFN